MRRRILVAIVGVTILATVVLTVPLAIVASVRARDEALHELERIAERTAAEISTAGLKGLDDIDLPDVSSNVDVAVYRPDGTRIVGRGPAIADKAVRSTKLLTRQRDASHNFVITRPIVLNETSQGVIRVAEPLSVTEAKVRRDLLALLGFDAVAIVIAAGVGWLVSSRMVRPLDQIRNDAVRLGAGDFAITARHSGIPELDATSDVLADTAGRLEDSLRREREFTANASHQLRTPLTALRVLIEGELISPRDEPSEVLLESMAEVDRLESTISTLLEVARNREVERTVVDVGEWAAEVGRRWETRCSATGRTAHFEGPGGDTVHVSREVIDEICDVLVDNALKHGQGAIEMEATAGSGAMTVIVTDSGRLDRDPVGLFLRNDPAASGTGVGLALARSLAEGEGGRLFVARTEPTQFKLVLPDWSSPAQHH